MYVIVCEANETNLRERNSKKYKHDTVLLGASAKSAMYRCRNQLSDNEK